MWHARLAQHYRHSAGVVAFGRFVQGCSSRSEAHAAGQDLTTLLGLKYMHVCIRCAPPKAKNDRIIDLFLVLDPKPYPGGYGPYPKIWDQDMAV